MYRVQRSNEVRDQGHRDNVPTFLDEGCRRLSWRCSRESGSHFRVVCEKQPLKVLIVHSKEDVQISFALLAMMLLRPHSDPELGVSWTSIPDAESRDHEYKQLRNQQ